MRRTKPNLFETSPFVASGLFGLVFALLIGSLGALPDVWGPALLRLFFYWLGGTVIFYVLVKALKALLPPR